MLIKFQDQPKLHKNIKNVLIKKFKKNIEKSDFILGDDIQIFESEFARYCGTKYAVGVSNGTDALKLAIKALGLSKGDEVIIPAMTYISTALSALYNGCKIKLCDINLEDGLINLKELKKIITKRTKCIIPVNFNGNYILNSELKKITSNKIKIIYDASQSHGCIDHTKIKLNKINYLKDTKANSDAFISCYSLYPGKNLGALGDAGIITTNNKKIYQKILNLRNIGSSKRFIHDTIGFNNRLDTIQAAFLNIKLKYLDSQNNNRRKNALFFDKNLKNNKINLIKHKLGSVYHNYVLLVENRNKFIKYLNKNNIQNNIHYPFSINNHAAIKKKFNGKSFINAEKYAKKCISIPVHPLLKKKELIKIVKVINNY
tara:strand:- start:572 stop:1690 length:1119 start_codon:yes stop_codon:yes gene_type:complete